MQLAEAPGPAAARHPAGRLGHPALLLVPLALSALAYSNTLHGEFQWDDQEAIVENPRIRHPSLFRAEDFLPAALVVGRPVSDLTFALDRANAGDDPFSFHLTSIAVHLAAVILVYLFTRYTLRRAGHPRERGLSLVVAGLFALHPLQSEAVSYLCQRSESLSAMFFLASLLLLFAAEDRLLRYSGRAAYAAALATFLLGIGSKIVAATMPLAWLLHSTWFRAPQRNATGGVVWRRILLAFPFIATSAICGLLLLRGLRGNPNAGFDAAIDVGAQPLGTWRYLLTQARVLVAYVRLLVWPAGQSVDHEFPPSMGLLEPRTLAALAFLAALAGLALFLRRRAVRAPGVESAPAANVTSFGILWFFLLLAPTSSLVPITDVMAEHRVYLASWGILVALVVGADHVLVRLLRRDRALLVGMTIALAAWVALGSTLYARNEAWRSELSLWRDALAQFPGSWRGHANLGFALHQAGDFEAALAEYRTVTELRPRPSAEWVFASRSIGAILTELGRLDESRGVLEKTLALAPDEPDVLNNLAACELEAGRLDSAAQAARRAIELRPENAGYFTTLGHVMLKEGNAIMALAIFRKAERLDPDLPSGASDVAVTAARLGLKQEACEAWRRVPDPADRAAVAERMAPIRCGEP